MKPLRFQRVDVSNFGPFDREQSLSLLEGLTLVAAGNGLGKTTVVKRLRYEYENTPLANPPAQYSATLGWLIFLDEDMPMPYGGRPWTPLATLISTYREFATKRSDFQDEVIRNIQQLLRAKAENLSSAFLATLDKLGLDVGEDGLLDFCVNDGEQTNHWFQASGERLVLYLSINSAVRKILSLDAPFVVDAQFGLLDGDLRRPCFQFAKLMSKQVLVLENDPVLKALDLKPSHRIAINQRTGKSIIRKFD